MWLNRDSKVKYMTNIPYTTFRFNAIYNVVIRCHNQASNKIELEFRVHDKSVLTLTSSETPIRNMTSNGGRITAAH